MSYVYRSTTGGTVNIASYVISSTGMNADAPIPELEAMVGVSIERVVLEEMPMAEPKSIEAELLAAPESPAFTAEIAETT